MIMKKRFTLLAMLCMAVFSVSTQAQVKGFNKQELESNEQIFVAPHGAEFRISPDGKMLAFFESFKDAPNVFVTGVNGGEFKQVSYVGDSGVESFYWLKNNHVAFLTAPDGNGKSSLFVGDIDSGEARRISPEGAHVRINAVSEADGTISFEVSSEATPCAYDLFSFNSADLNSKLLISTEFEAIRHATDNAASIAFSYSYLDGGLRQISAADSKLKMLENSLQFRPLASSTIHKGNYYCISDNARNGAALVEVNLADGQESQVVFAKAGSSVERVFLTPKDHKPVMVWYRGKENGFQLIDKAYSGMMEDMRSKLKGVEALQIVSCSFDEKVWIVLNEYADGRKIYYRYNVSNKDIRQLNEVDMSYEIKRAKVMVQTLSDTRGKEMVLRVYSPPVEEIKSPAIIVFGEHMWGLHSQEHHELLMALSEKGFPVVEIDLVHSQSYGAAAFLNGYDWWSNMLVSDVQVVITALNRTFPAIPGIIPCGIGIGSAIAMKVVSIYPDMKMRSMMIQPFFNEGDYIRFLQECRGIELRYMLKADEQLKEEPVMDYKSAPHPLVIYSTQDVPYAEGVNAMMYNFSLAGNAAEIMNYSDDFGIPKTAASFSQVVDEITRYATAVPVRKIK